ncbi:MAG: amino acid adenylation domain-containing protein [Candidatus Eremiobacteraeota bacterium]|nr:amino acid adenylation domain-containing protein [Candidatus Eremiobacteraeota bacterium]
MTTYRYNVALAFEHLVETCGERPAIKLATGAAVTYRDLDRSANRIAAALARRGVRRRDVVAIAHEKSPGCFAAMFAALKLGAAYVNLDEQNPVPRLQHIFATAQPKAVFADAMPASIAAAAAGSGAELWDLADSRVAAEVSAAANEPPPERAAVTGADPAYIMYTSGSTGVPKGAIVTHASVLNFGAWCGERFGIEPHDVVTNLNPMYFDNSVFDVYSALLNGASIAPVTRATLSNPAALLEQVERAGCTVWYSVPSLLIYLTTLKLLDATRLPAIRQLVFGGEVYPQPELRKLYAIFAGRSALVNVYGPTECTCLVTSWDIGPDDLKDQTGFAIGPANPNCTALVVRDGRRAQPGETGELYILGPQVALGYVRDPERTEKAFVRNPLDERWSERAYRTGDLVRVGEGGRKLYFLGRVDNQVKHMGYRIELEEIEAALNRIPGVVQAAVVQKPDSTGMPIIAAYVAPGDAPAKARLREALLQMLPPYMIPQHFEIRDSLPKNANGKVDRVALARE